MSLDATVGAAGSPDVTLDVRPWPSRDERRGALESSLIRLRDHIEAASMFRARALAGPPREIADTMARSAKRWRFF